MKVFFLEDDPGKIVLPQGKQVLALGFFDGIHLGHQEVIKKAKNYAQNHNYQLSVVTFDKRPQILWQKFQPEFKKLITPSKIKKELLVQLGVDFCYLINFNSKFASQSPKEFIQEYLLKFHPQAMVAGFDFTFGRKGQANIKDLAILAGNKIPVFKIPPVFQNGAKVSSTLIRQLLDQGKISQVNLLLGRGYQTEGIVVHGEARGRTLGFPTANIEVNEETILPSIGVYVTKVQIAGNIYPSMGSIGMNETFGLNQRKTVEINVFDFQGNIYGNQVRVTWLNKIRDQIRFANSQELIKQLKMDQKLTKEYFKGAPLGRI